MRLRFLALAPVLMVTASLVPQAEASSTRPGASTATSSRALEGPDVSKYQHSTGKLIDWAAVRRSGQDFAFIKATGGSNRVDPWFEREWAAAGRAGMIRGAYHYADPSHSAVEQAARIVSVVGSTREANDLGIVLDLETSGGLSPARLARWAHAFLNEVERRTARVPILYTSPNFWHTKMRDNRTFGAYPLWLAHYTNKRPGPLPGWNRWTFWQHTSSYRLPGIRGAVDHNFMCCSVNTLRALADGRSVRITRLWRALGGASGGLGLPLGMETPVAGGGWSQVFEHGGIVSSRRGTFAVTGDTWARYQANGGVRGALGVPVAPMQSLPGGLTQQRFAGGRVVWSQATGAHALQGDFEARWLADGGATAAEGLPIGEATTTTQQFAGGGLYRTPAGVRLVPAAMRDRYEEFGGPAGAMGLPLGEVREALGGRAIDFQAGTLYEIEIAGQKIVL
ncbi:MAG TPA: GH25 family lysozyme [Mycobacteriales bacterium]|nr:GH25 family lysozyme [Mycobacteriales bacterium]